MVWLHNKVDEVRDHFFFLTILFFIFLASLPERTLPSWFLRCLILVLSCFSLLRILFFLCRTIISGFSLFFYRFVVPPAFSFGWCLNFSFPSFICFLSAFCSVFDILQYAIWFVLMNPCGFSSSSSTSSSSYDEPSNTYYYFFPFFLAFVLSSFLIFFVLSLGCDSSCSSSQSISYYSPHSITLSSSDSSSISSPLPSSPSSQSSYPSTPSSSSRSSSISSSSSDPSSSPLSPISSESSYYSSSPSSSSSYWIWLSKVLPQDRSSSFFFIILFIFLKSSSVRTRSISIGTSPLCYRYSTPGILPTRSASSSSSCPSASAPSCLPLPLNFLGRRWGLQSRTKLMTDLAARETFLFRYSQQVVRQSIISSVTMEGSFLKISRRVLRPIVMVNSEQRSLTKCSMICLTRVSISSSGTSSWMASASAARTR